MSSFVGLTPTKAASPAQLISSKRQPVTSMFFLAPASIALIYIPRLPVLLVTKILRKRILSSCINTTCSPPVPSKRARSLPPYISTINGFSGVPFKSFKVSVPLKTAPLLNSTLVAGSLTILETLSNVWKGDSEVRPLLASLPVWLST